MYEASLDKCRELYELSGWGGCHGGYSKYPAPEPIGHEYRLEMRSNPSSPKRGSIPAYDAGYLLRKLPTQVYGARLQLRNNQNIKAARPKVWEVGYASKLWLHAETPEDALATLAIELIKGGVLNPKGEA